MTSRGQILMCRPSQFNVEYVINPWMEGHVGRVRRDVSSQQWDRLHEIVSQRVDVRVIDGGCLPDEVRPRPRHGSW